MNNIEGIITALKEQRDRLNTAIHSLEQTGDYPFSSRSAKRRGRKRRRSMSEAARKRISSNMKARWANAKEAGRNSL